MSPVCLTNSHIITADDRKSVDTHHGKNRDMSSDEGDGIRNSDRNAVRRERDDESNKVILSERREASDAFVSNERQARMEDVILIVRI